MNAIIKDAVDPIMDPRQIGHDLLGPVYAEFFTRLHAFMRSHDAAARRFFVARAGVRLRRLYHVYTTARGIAPAETEIMWMSRLLATKALYGLDDDLFFESVRREFKNGRIGEFAKALSRHRSEPIKLGALRREPVGRLREHLDAGRLKQLHEFLSAEAEAARGYIRSCLGGDGQAFLIDSGWHGTIHRLLQPNSEAALTSLLLARVRRTGEVGPPENELVGLVVESDEYDQLRPESALVFHRHLIEAPLEPPSPSIERVCQDENGRSVFPEAEGCDRVDPGVAPDQIFLGIEDYLRGAGARGLSQVHTQFVEAVGRLASAILHPSRLDTAALDVGVRSADFGRDYSAPVLLPAENRFEGDGPSARVRDALWPQGQAVIEFGEGGAASFHKQLSGEEAPEDYFHPWKRTSSDDGGGRVAVVTRTKNRPVLLRRAAESVASQTYGDVAWVIVNDGGDQDAVLDVIRKSWVRRSVITLVSNAESVGMEAASNLGAAAVDSRFITIHDDDDAWHPRFLEKTVDFLRNNSDQYQGVITHTTRVSEEVVGENIIIHKREPYNTWVRSINLLEMSAGNLFPPIAFLFTRDIYEKAGRFPEHLPVLGDWDFNLRVLAISDIGVIPTALAFYHHRDVGDPLLYGNSVIAGRNKHLEYDALVRNAMFRGEGQEPGAGNLAALAYTLKVIRAEVGRLSGGAVNAGPVASTSSGGGAVIDADVLWVSMSLLNSPAALATARRGRYARFLDRVMRRLARSLTPSYADLVALAQGIPWRQVPPPPDWNERAYLRQNADVRKALKAGRSSVKSGWEHYLKFGKAEGRRRPRRRG